jgi:hypothetical protein
MCISAAFNADDIENNNKLLDTNDYRNIGLLHNPLLSNVVITYSSSTSGFADGEIITQADSGARGEVVRVTDTTLKLTNVSKFFGSGNSSYNLIRSSGGATARVDSVAGPTTYIDQTYKLVIDNPAGQFQEDELVTQGSHANGVMYFANNTVMRITGKKGVINVSDDVVGTVETISGTTSSSTSKITDVIAGDLVPNSGQVMYIENVKPVKRYNQQSETLKLILQF